MKKPSLPPGLRQQPVDNFIAGGGEVAAEKAAKPTTGKKLRKSDSAVVAYTLRIATSKVCATTSPLDLLPSLVPLKETPTAPTHV